MEGERYNMTIKYLDSKRFSGTSTGNITSAPTPTSTNTYDDTSAWAKTGTTVTVDDSLAGKVYGNGNTPNGNDYVSKAIGTTLSDTTWTATMDLIIDSGLDYYSKPFLLVAGTGDAYTSNQDAIGFGFNGNQSNDAQVFFMWKDGTSSFSFTGSGINLVKGDQYYITVTRTLANSVTINVYTDEARTNEVTNSPQSYAMSSSIGGLTHIHHGMLPDSANDQAIFTIDNLKIYNGITSSASSTSADYTALTNVQDNSIFVETDTARRYWFDGLDISTASYDSNSFSITNEDTSPKDVHFKPDGTKMYVLGYDNKRVYQYSLSTAWDISTASYDSVSFDPTTNTPYPYALTFSADGTKMYLNDISALNVAGEDAVIQYSLSTAWDLSTASYASKYLGYASQEDNARNICFNSDGTKLFVVGVTNDNIYQYNLTTAYDVSTGSFYKSSSVASEDTVPQGLFLKSDDSKIYMGGSTNDKVFQYSLSPTWTMEPTYQDDFSTDKGWTNLTSNTSITTKLNYSEVSSTYIRATKDLQDSNALGSGNNMSDNFVIRFELNKTNDATNTSNGTQPLIGISSATTDGWFNNQDSVGMLISQDTNQTHGIRAVGADNQYTYQGDSADASYTWTTGIRYCEVIKNATADTVTATLYSDSGYSDSLVTATVSTSGKTISGLRYLSMRNFADSSRSSTVWEMNNIQVYDGVTSVN